MVIKVRTLKIVAISAAAAAAALLIGGSIAHACPDIEIESEEPVIAEFVCQSEGSSYEPIVLKIAHNATGLEVKEQLASALNDGGIYPTDIYLTYDNGEGGVDQLYNDELFSDYIVNGDIVNYVIAPISYGEVIDGNMFESYNYDQYSGEFRYIVTVIDDEDEEDIEDTE